MYGIKRAFHSLNDYKQGQSNTNYIVLDRLPLFAILSQGNGKFHIKVPFLQLISILLYRPQHITYLFTYAETAENREVEFSVNLSKAITQKNLHTVCKCTIHEF